MVEVLPILKFSAVVAEICLQDVTWVRVALSDFSFWIAAFGDLCWNLVKLFSRVKYTYFVFCVKFLGFWIFVGIFAGVEIFALVKLWWVVLGGNNFWWIRLFSFGILLLQWWKFLVENLVGWRFLFWWGFGGCFLVWEIFVGFDYYRILLIWLLSIFSHFCFLWIVGHLSFWGCFGGGGT